MQSSDLQTLPAQRALTLVSGNQTGPLCEKNKQILSNYAGRIYTKITKSDEPHQQVESRLQRVFNSLTPSAYTVGSNIGWAASLTYGSQALNFAIGQLVSHYLPVQQQQSSSWFGSMSSAAARTEQRVAVESARLALTPQLLPFLTAACTSGGGLTMMGAVALASILYNRILRSPESKYTMNNLPDIDQLLTVNKDGKIVDANGTEMTMQDLTDIFNTINRYDLTCKLMNAKKEEIEGVLNGYLRDKVTLWNGEKISPKNVKKIEEVKNRLMGNNPMDKAKGIKKVIKLLSDNVLPVNMSLEDLNRQMQRKPGPSLLEVKPLDEDQFEWIYNDAFSVGASTSSLTPPLLESAKLNQDA